MKAVTCENKAANKKKRMRLNEKGKNNKFTYTLDGKHSRTHLHIYARSLTLAHTKR